MSDRVAGVQTKQDRDITALVNGSSRPLAFLTMLYGENSGLDEHSRRNEGHCDISGNLPHISICRAVEAGLVPAGDLAAFWAWTERTEQVLDVARAWFETQIAWAEQTLGNAHSSVDLLAACWWNAPAAGAVAEARAYGMADQRTRDTSAAFWLAPDLAQISSKYAANRANYVRGRGQAERYRVKEEPMPTDAPEFKLGFKEFADAHPEVGAPLENEHYLAGDDHYSLQMAEGGLLIYSKEANRVQLLGKG